MNKPILNGNYSLSNFQKPRVMQKKVQRMWMFERAFLYNYQDWEHK